MTRHFIHIAALAAIMTVTAAAPSQAVIRRAAAGRPMGGGATRRAPTNINRGGAAFNNGNRTAINSGNHVGPTHNGANINNNVNVNVDNGWDGCCHNGWYGHPVAAGVAFGATAAITAAAIGSVAHTLPPSCVGYTYGSYYYQCGDVWYQPQYVGTTVTYVVVKEPPH